MSASPAAATITPHPTQNGVGPAAEHAEHAATVAMALAAAASASSTGGNDGASMAAASPLAAAAAAATGTESAGDGKYEDLATVDDKRPKRGFSKRVTLRDLERYFEYPIEQVSTMMGVSTTIIKRLCRKYGIKRWPYRQVNKRSERVYPTQKRETVDRTMNVAVWKVFLLCNT